MRKQFQFKNRTKVQRRKHRPDETLHADKPSAKSSEHIMDLQQTVGNQAVMRMMGGKNVEQAKASPFDGLRMFRQPQINEALTETIDQVDHPEAKQEQNNNALTIQRFPQIDEARRLLPDSASDMVQNSKDVILNMMTQYRATLDNYHQGFPKTAEEVRAGDADAYFDATVATLDRLAVGIRSNISAIGDYTDARKNKRKAKWGKNKHKKRYEKLRRLKNQLPDEGWTKDDLAPIHHSLIMNVMAGANDLSHITSDQLTGDMDEDAAKGGVHSLSKGTVNTVKDGVKTGYFKADEADPDDAGIGIGIKRHEGKQSLRAVATYQVSELLGMGIIPYTALTKGQDEEGNTTTGQFMEEVEGFAGRGKKLEAELPEDKSNQVRSLLDQLKNPETDPSQKANIKEQIESIVGVMGHKEVDGKIYKLGHATADIDWMTPVIQKDLSTLQLFDMIVGHADRHPENYIVETGRDGSMKGVKGIDNDSVWGSKADAEFMEKSRWGWKDKSKTPGVPPVLDAEVALQVVRTPWKAIEAILSQYALSAEEITAAESRWGYVQEKVKDLILSNSLAAMDTADQIFMYVDLYDAIGEPLPADIMEKQMMEWGEQTADLMTTDNSYAGREKAGDMADGHIKPEDYQ